MSEPQLYEREPEALTAQTTVLSVVGGQEPTAGVWLELEDTLFYPEGGGQPSDRGTIDGVQLLDVQKRAGRVGHRVESGRFEVGQVVSLQLDGARRFDHSQQHTAQHLLSAMAQDHFGWATTAFHLGPERCDIELDVGGLQAADLEALEEAVAGRIRAALPVTARRISFERYQQMSREDSRLRSRGLPDGHVGEVRLVEIEGVDLSSCAGTHLTSTAQIEAMQLLGTEGLRGGTRLYWVAGRRLRRRCTRAESLLGELRAALDAPTEELAAAARARADQLRSHSKEVKFWQQRWAEATGAAIVLGDEVHIDLTGCDLAQLQLVARESLRQGARRALLLTATSADGQRAQARGGPFVLLVPEASGLDARELGSEIAALLGGRGGGSGNLFQGRADSYDGVAAAVSRLSGS